MNSRDTKKERKIIREKLLELLIGDAPIPREILEELTEEDILALLRKRKHNLDVERKLDSIESKIKGNRTEIRKSVKKASESNKTSIDDIAKTRSAVKKALQKAYNQQAASLYAQQEDSSYFPNYSYTKNVRQQSYGSDGLSMGKIELDIQQEENFFKPKFDESLFREVIRAKKIKDTYGIDVYVNPVKQSLFDSWNAGHKLDSQILYGMINI